MSLYDISSRLSNATARTEPSILYAIHEGFMNYICINSTGVADGGVKNFYIETSTGYEYHLVYLASCGGQMMVTISTTPTLATTGTAYTVKNRNISDAVATSATVSSTVTYTSEGNVLCKMMFGSTGRTAYGDSKIKEESHWVLNDGKDYLIEIKNMNGDTAAMTLAVEWCEMEK